MYTPRSPIPQDLPGLVRWLVDEFQAIRGALNQPRGYLELETLYAEPAKIQDDADITMIARADGVSWSPGGGGPGIYARIGGAWVKL